MWIFKRFGQALVGLNFCAEELWADDGLRPTWRFWWFWNSLLVSLLSIAGFFVLKNVSQAFEAEFTSALPAFEIAIVDGKLKTNLPDPRLLETDEAVLVLDTKQVAYEKEVLNNYNYGLFVTETAALILAKEESVWQELKFSAWPDQQWSKAKLVDWWQDYETSILLGFLLVILVFLAIFTTLFTLILSLGLAIFSWLLGRVFGADDWRFGRNFSTWLHYSVVFLYAQMALSWSPVLLVCGSVIILGMALTNLYRVATGAAIT